MRYYATYVRYGKEAAARIVVPDHFALDPEFRELVNKVSKDVQKDNKFRSPPKQDSRPAKQQRGAPAAPARSPAPRDKRNDKCKNCGRLGHWASECRMAAAAPA